MEPSYVLKDFSEYEERILFGLTLRQLIWGGIAVFSGVSFYLTATLVLKLPEDIGIYGTVLISFFLFWMGWRKWQSVRPYTDKLKAMYKFYTTKQKVFFNNGASYFKNINVYSSLKGEKSIYVWKKKRECKKINKEYCKEYKGN